MKYSEIITRVKVFFTKKRIIWTAVLLVVLFLGWLIFGRKSSGSNIQTGVVKTQDIQKTVLTTGQVVSATDLDLSFQTSGVVKKINVQEGDVVSAGKVLAVLDQSNPAAQLESAQGALAQAKANYDKLAAAATSQDIAVSQASVDVATTALNNAKQNLLNELSTAYNNVNTAVLVDTNNLFGNPQTLNPQFSIAGTVQTNSDLVGKVNNERQVVNSNFANWQTEVANISDDNIDQVVNDSLSYISITSNYFNDVISLLSNYTQVSSGGSQSSLSSYQAAAASGKATVDGSYTTINSDSQAVKSASSSLEQAKASLLLKQSPARPEDLSIADAQVLSAQGQVHLAEAALNNTVIVAPIDGTITQVDIKLGEQATASKEVMVLINVGQLHTEADVSEADIASVAVGQSIDETFDALGPDRHFTSKVLTVNPASTVISGVVDYKVTGSLENISDVKPGMTVNMTILVAEKAGAIVVPSSAIVNQDGKRFVKVIDDLKKNTYHQVEVQTGLEADGGLTEILSGLSVGQTVVTYIK